jgi:hypothetical protein
MLRNAYKLFRAYLEPPVPVVALAPSASVSLRFGSDGNAQRHMGYGWSTPEIGFTWATDDRSLLTLDALPPAANYWLDMDVAPFVVPPVLPSQRLAVQINGETVHVFDPLGNGPVACAVPGHLIHGRSRIEIVLEHPHAARPHDVSDSADVRRLAIAFRSLSLTMAPGA